MDPDQVLSDLREIFRKLDDATDLDVKTELALEAAEKFNALDEWMTMGGFRPREWRGIARS